MKDHELRDFVNALRDVALEYADTQQLRGRIAEVVHNFLKQQADGAHAVAENRRIHELDDKLPE